MKNIKNFFLVLAIICFFGLAQQTNATYTIKSLCQNITIKTGKEISGALIKLAIKKPKVFIIGGTLTCLGTYLIAKSVIKSILNTTKTFITGGAGIILIFIASSYLDKQAQEKKT